MADLPLFDRRPLTIADYVAMPEEDDRRFEVQEGMLVTSPRPLGLHQRAQLRLAVQLEPQVPRGLLLVPDVDLDLGADGTVLVVEIHSPFPVRLDLDTLR